MEYRRLGRTDINVSVICLGTMTWGQQNTQDEAFEQLDYAVGNEINFIDTAEMYPVPVMEETFSRTETIIGNWLEKRGKRDDLVIASKIVGPGDRFPYVRGGPRLTRDQIFAAIDGSLSRLKTDYLDLYQLHWPDRNCNFFGKLGYEHDENEDFVPIEETLSALDEIVKAGKVRHIGLSNETPWGLMKFLELAEKNGWPRVVSVQNPYSLINRSYEVGLAECSIREDAGLLAYSPLGGGALSGKYLNGARPEGARSTLWPEYFGRYLKENGVKATEAYVKLAQDNGLDPCQMALAYVNSRPFLTANIIGATSMEHLKTNIGSAHITLSDEVLAEIENIQTRWPNPCP
ncbi:NADP(H)-dependent aldo-keto reductase [Thalassospira sp. TSL5-1]|uniref:NADP(H)-dependent aldo-keto reductase n=1 Tax=Thalassospira sp. TSL5-1 TaxID=1544451 RepID=UPI00093F5C53|nr:NADP(H)-dependent aldo-keto reductase [Thalassospira sp. TSL5-1]OKH87603.1 aldo/keto reductase [Thalassospira sp. TSL5-1]